MVLKWDKKLFEFVFDFYNILGALIGGVLGDCLGNPLRKLFDNAISINHIEAQFEVDSSDLI